jgi:hypothetical protein
MELIELEVASWERVVALVGMWLWGALLGLGAGRAQALNKVPGPYAWAETAYQTTQMN